MIKTIYGFGKRPEDVSPSAEQVTDIIGAVRRLFEPGNNISDSDIHFNNEQMKEALERILGEDMVHVQTMVRELEQEGFKQEAAGNVLYWCLKRKG